MILLQLTGGLAVLSAVLYLILVAYPPLLPRSVFPPAQPTASSSSSATPGKHRVLLVIAHPDDECMFFAPTIVNLARRRQDEVHVLCLSTGNHDGQGNVRKEELVRSCAVLGIHESHITVFDDPKLPDNPRVAWNTALVAAIIESHVQNLSIDMLITFDSRGISGHANHIAAYLGVVQMLERSPRFTPENLPCYRLTTVPLVRKYVGLFDMLFSVSGVSKTPSGVGIQCSADSLLFVASPSEVMLGRRAMYEHESQLLWFRQLSVIFSRYMYINRLDRIQ
ncbi:LmbE-like protein [Ramicandelaber brevisporus]|nr:LmbE-like protein [Ramicandelaber brevisporus]